jgi:hypothetical protein
MPVLYDQKKSLQCDGPFSQHFSLFHFDGNLSVSFQFYRYNLLIFKISIFGRKTDIYRHFCYRILSFLTFGLLPLFSKWFPAFKNWVIMRKSVFKDASHVYVEVIQIKNSSRYFLDIIWQKRTCEDTSLLCIISSVRNF